MKIVCPKCGTKNWAVVNLCLGCVRADKPVTLALHDCYVAKANRACERHETDVAPGCDGCILEMLRNLLAVIHGDGGHHTDWVGLKQSVEDAMRIASTASTVSRRDK